MANPMAEIFDTTTIVTIVIAVFVLLRLRSVLGKRTGHQRPPFEPYEIDRKTREARPSAVKRSGDDTFADKGENDNVVELPGQKAARRTRSQETSPLDKLINDYAKPGTKLNAGLREIAASDSAFTPEGFISGARMAYEMIVTAFADGDRKTLKNLLSREVYDGFASAISERENRNEKVESNFVGIENAKITNAGVSASDAQVTVQFVSQIISSTVNSKGEIIDGDPEQVGEVKDIWTFARDIRSRDPNWKLVATESDS
jgi:predicted lipid-binding transport protein (Tim44 family)